MIQVPSLNERISCEQVIRERKRSLDREQQPNVNEDADVGLSKFLTNLWNAGLFSFQLSANYA